MPEGTMHAVILNGFGGPEVLSFATLPAPEPGPGEATVRLRAIGLNFADIYRRRGEYALVPPEPFVNGYEGAGVVERVGDGVVDIAPGDRVAFADVPRANAELVVAPVDRLVPLPDDISFDDAAAVMLQGMTAHYLVRDSHPLRPGETVVVHAAAGGVGQLLVQVGKRLGARVIGIVSTEEKATIATAAGADAVLLSTSPWSEEVKRLTGGKGADVVYDAVGTTLEASLDATRARGRVVFYGWAGGEPPRLSPKRLMDDSKTLTGGDLWSHLENREERMRRARDLFAWMREGALTVRISARFPLAAAADAHALLESRRSVGKILLVP